MKFPWMALKKLLPADVALAPEGEPSPVEEPVAEEPPVDEYKTLEAGHPDAVDATEHLTETDAASSDYKKTTSGHKTESPRRAMSSAKQSISRPPVARKRDPPSTPQTPTTRLVTRASVLATSRT